jgi:hypothetical protein
MPSQIGPLYAPLMALANETPHLYNSEEAMIRVEIKEN